MIASILFGAAALGILVIVHEFGHFAVSKLFKVKVEKFSVGFGPRIYGKKSGDTDYMISVVPLGGYVKLSGQTLEELTRPPEPYDFISKPWWARALIVFGGPAMNFLFAVVLGISIFLIGVKFQDFAPVAGRVFENSFPYRLGLKEGDRIKSVNGEAVATWKAIDQKLALGDKKNVDARLSVERDGKEFLISWSAGLADSFLGGVSPPIKPSVGSVVPGLPAYVAGMRTGDRITSINSRPVRDWYDVQSLIHSSPDTTIVVRVVRDGRVVSFSMKTVSQEIPGGGKIGLVGISYPESLTYVVRTGVKEAFARGVSATVAMTVQTYRALWTVATHPYKFRESIAGPVAIVQMSGDEARKGMDSYLIFVLAVSVALMVFNLLPIPVLDGGHILFSFFEGVSGRPLSSRKQRALQKVGLGLLIALMALALLNDMTKIVHRRGAFDRAAEERSGTDR